MLPPYYKVSGICWSRSPPRKVLRLYLSWVWSSKVLRSPWLQKLEDTRLLLESISNIFTFKAVGPPGVKSLCWCLTPKLEIILILLRFYYGLCDTSDHVHISDGQRKTCEVQNYRNTNTFLPILWKILWCGICFKVLSDWIWLCHLSWTAELQQVVFTLSLNLHEIQFSNNSHLRILFSRWQSEKLQVKDVMGLKLFPLQETHDSLYFQHHTIWATLFCLALAKNQNQTNFTFSVYFNTNRNVGAQILPEVLLRSFKKIQNIISSSNS